MLDLICKTEKKSWQLVFRFSLNVVKADNNNHNNCLNCDTNLNLKCLLKAVLATKTLILMKPAELF